MNVPSMQQLLEAGVHFGHQTRRGHPKMSEYIYGAREGVHIINLEFSEKLLKEAATVANDFGKEGKTLLIVGTKKQAQDIVKEISEAAGAPYVNFKWVGGLLTNFDEIKKNIKKLEDLKIKQDKGELKHYTKKEQLLISRKLEKFNVQYGGIRNLNKLPDALFLIDSVNEKSALNEAVYMDIPVIAIADTNSNPQLLTYPIPGNDDATRSIKILSETIAQAYGEGLMEFHKKGIDTKEALKKENEIKIEDKGIDPQIIPDIEKAEELVEKIAVAEATRLE